MAEAKISTCSFQRASLLQQARRACGAGLQKVIWRGLSPSLVAYFPVLAGADGQFIWMSKNIEEDHSFAFTHEPCASSLGHFGRSA
jgi:hypothetical protein